jgi:hypothetical protein
MTSNYYTLAAVVREAERVLIGLPFLEAYSLRPDELRLVFEGDHVLVALLRPVTGALFLSDRPEQKTRKNVRQFFESLSGNRLQAIRISDTDREITLAFDDATVSLSFYGKPNAVMLGPGITQSFKKQGTTLKPI